MLFVIFGFFLQIIGDSLYTYLSVYGSYQLGGFVDLIWLVALLFIGFAGYHAQKTKKEITLVVKNPFEEREFIFPYSSIMVLLALVIYSYRWNFNWLSSALLIIFFMVLGRQLLVINRNNKLVKEYRHLAYHDPLTGLNNRASFTETVENSLKKHKTDKMALLLIDLDRFKVVNDTLGHLVGDQILIKTADRLRQALGEEASLFRLGGDEFVIIISDTTERECSVTAEHLLKNFQEPFSVGDYEINVTPSIGISIYPDHGVNSEDLLKNADAAMYTAKENGKNNFSFYNSELNSIMTRKLKIENELRKAIESEQFILHYQPKVDLPTKRFIGMEALLRWEHPELGWITPGEFIPIAEETGQIVSIGEWVLKEACKQNKAWQENGFSPLCVSVNVSVLQFQQDDFLLTVKEALEESGLEPQFLELEITESIMQNIRESVKILESLRAMGIKTSIDDFGTGYSSLNILQELPIDTIKIDKSFIDGIGSTNQQAMVKTIIDLGVNLNLTVVAEGIESEQQMEALIHSNCNIGQGFLFSRAVAPEDFENILKVNNMKLEKV
ncbi:EAL domain-containing protein [Planococcus salinus]|uniref:EAL domain-containing protein n=1 Tax=Planococcus salinus TaxID=1848460 RepID=A0A3M8P9U8_9BACL|nr:EAL domain-containing protein [Planococcus salinus]